MIFTLENWAGFPKIGSLGPFSFLNEEFNDSIICLAEMVQKSNQNGLEFFPEADMDQGGGNIVRNHQLLQSAVKEVCVSIDS